MYKFKFADIGEGLHEGVVGEIYHKEGDMVKEGDSLFSVETDKITTDIPSPKTGKIVKILMAAGDTIHVGQEIYHIDDGSGDSAEAESTPAPAATEQKAEAPAEAGASVVGEVKVSNDLLDFSSWATTPSTPKAEAAPAAKVEAAPAKTSQIQDSYSGKVDEEFDAIVIGSGPGGYLAASEIGAQGLKVLIVEKEYWGGVCLNVGCIPTKALLKTSEVAHYVAHAEEYGLEGKSSLKPNWKKMHERKAQVVGKLVEGVKAIVRGAKAKSVEGTAKFLSAKTIEVDGKVYRGKYMVLANGSTDRKLDLPGFADGYASGAVLTSKEAINLADKPKSLVIVGGGVIGVEFAQVFASAGVQVTILQNLDRVLANLDADISKEITTKLKELGVEIITNSQVVAYEKGQVVYQVGSEQHKIKAEKTLVSVGRIPNSQGLAEVGLKLGQRQEVVVDEYCQTNVEGVYAIGDIVGQAMLAHVAYRHAVITASHIAGKADKYIDKTVPSCIYTSPEIASVGLTEAQAKEKGFDFVVGKMAFAHIGKAIAGGNTTGFAKLIVDKQYGEIIGAHIVGANATDMISEIIVAMDVETTVYEIAAAIHPHPTYSEIIWEAARNAVVKLEKLKK